MGRSDGKIEWNSDKMMIDGGVEWWRNDDWWNGVMIDGVEWRLMEWSDGKMMMEWSDGETVMVKWLIVVKWWNEGNN